MNSTNARPRPGGLEAQTRDAAHRSLKRDSRDREAAAWFWMIVRTIASAVFAALAELLRPGAPRAR